MLKKSLLFLAVTPLMAISIPKCSDLEWSGGAEALYWRGYEKGVEYGFILLQPSLGRPFGLHEQLELQPCYGWGFRVFSKVQTTCLSQFAELEWIHFRNTTTASTHQPIVNFPDGSRLNMQIISPIPDYSFRPASDIKARQHDRYNNVTLRLGHTFINNCRGRVYGYLGGGWREIHVADTFAYKLAALKTQELVLHFSGGAIVLGFGFNANIGCGFGANMRGGFVVAIGGLSQAFTAVGIKNNVLGEDHVDEFAQVNCIVGYEALGSVHYTKECGCVSLRGEIGYRVDYYFSLAGLSLWTEFISPAVPGEQVNRGYGGPFAGLSVRY